MATNFPGSLDSFTNPSSSSTLDSPSHAAQHSNVNDAVEALQTKVGVDGSAVTSSLDYKVAQQGLTLITTASATSGSTLDLNGIFSDTFESYRLVVTQYQVSFGAYGLDMQMKAGGTVTTTGYYGAIHRYDLGAGSYNAATANNTSLAYTGIITTTTSASGIVDIQSPYKPWPTRFGISGMDSRPGTTGYVGIVGQFKLDNTTSYDSLRLLHATTFVDLEVKVYGYNDG